MKIIGLMACDPNGLIGKGGHLPWHYPEELEHFRAVTHRKTLIMGRKTFDGLPNTLLSDRHCIVFSKGKNTGANAQVLFVDSIDACLQAISLLESNICYMIGGGQIAELFFAENLLTEFILTRIKKQYSGDVFLPTAILNWPHTPIKHHTDFLIDHYFNPRNKP